jgi:hypothetical protein
MPATLMQHDTDPREALLAKIGDLSDIEIFQNKVLVAIYQRPKVTAGGIHLTDDALDEDLHQGKVAWSSRSARRPSSRIRTAAGPSRT